MTKPRRRFLKSAASLAGAAMACEHFQPESLGAAEQTGGGAAPRPMPMLPLGPHQVSRIIIGSNPFHGYSHFNRIHSQEMTAWHTPAKVCELLRQAEGEGINTWQFSHHQRAMGDLERHRNEGGTMQWLLLSHGEMEADHSLIQKVAKLKPLGIAHHGGSAERKRRAGRLDQVKDFLKSVRDSGVMVGLSTHDPRFLEQAEEENWDVDYYMTALYYLTRTPEEFQELLGQRPIGEIYLPEDPPRMFATIRQTKKPCLCYKVLAAGRLSDRAETIDEAFRVTFANIKPNDGVIVGVYPRFSNHVAENAERVRKFGAVKV